MWIPNKYPPAPGAEYSDNQTCESYVEATTYIMQKDPVMLKS